MTKPLYFYNGSSFEQIGPVVPQSPIAYQTSAPTGPATGDLWIDSDGDVDTYTRQLTRYKFVASGGETSLSGPDANNVTLAYTAGSEMVYLNGALLNRGSDYVATNGTSITSLAALSLNDIVEVFAYVAFNPANTYTKSEADGLFANGLQLVVPSSVSVGSGSGSVSSGGAVTFSGASSVSLNNIFSSTYDNYRIIFNNCSGSAVSNQYIQMRLRKSGTDNTSNIYYRQYVDANSTTVSGARVQTTFWLVGVINNTTIRTSSSLDIYSPQVATIPTSFNNILLYNAIATPCYQTATGTHDLNSSADFDGATFFADTGTFSGTIRIYGYRNG